MKKNLNVHPQQKMFELSVYDDGFEISYFETISEAIMKMMSLRKKMEKPSVIANVCMPPYFGADPKHGWICIDPENMYTEKMYMLKLSTPFFE